MVIADEHAEPIASTAIEPLEPAPGVVPTTTEKVEEAVKPAETASATTTSPTTTASPVTATA